MGKGGEIKEWDPQMASKNFIRKKGVLKLGSGEVFTFAFTSPEKLQAFVNYQKETGALGLVGKEVMAFWMTLEEYFANPDNNELYIVPPVDFGLPCLN